MSDSALTQIAVVPEVTPGTTPATPAFKVLRTISAAGSPQQNDQRSPERRADGRVANMYTGLVDLPKSVILPFARDDGNDELIQSVMFGAFSTDALKDGSTFKSLTLETKYGGQVSPTYIRSVGCAADSLALSMQVGQPGQMTFNLRHLSEPAADTTAITLSTYADPTPALDPVTPADIAVNDLFGITNPRVMALNLNIGRNLENRYSFGSRFPYSLRRGNVDVVGDVQFYFENATQYSTFQTRQTGLTLDLIIGSVTNEKDRIEIFNADVWNPNVSDPGQTGDHLVTLQFMARFDPVESALMEWTRNVA